MCAVKNMKIIWSRLTGAWKCMTKTQTVKNFYFVNTWNIFVVWLLAVCAVVHFMCTVYPKKFTHGFCFAVLCCGYTLTGFPISIRLTSLALWQSDDCPSASKATLMNMDKHFIGIHYERLHNHNKAKHNKTVCIFLGIHCKTNPESTTRGYSIWISKFKLLSNSRLYICARIKCLKRVWLLASNLGTLPIHTSRLNHPSPYIKQPRLKMT